jgi:transposase
MNNNIYYAIINGLPQKGSFFIFGTTSLQRKMYQNSGNDEEEYQLYKIKRYIKISRRGAKSQFAKILFKAANPSNAGF